MIRFAWLGMATVGMGLIAGCGGGEGPTGDGNSGDGDSASGGSLTGGDGDGDGDAAGGTAGDGDTGPRYGDAFGSLTEICDILAFAQTSRIQECNGFVPPDEPSPVFTCPDVLFSEGSTRVRTVEGAWDCVNQWKAMSCQEIHDGLVPDCVTPGTLEAGAPCIAASQCASTDCTGYGEQCGVCLETGDGVTCGGDVGCTGINYCDGATCVSPVVDPATPPATVSDPGEVCSGLCTEGYACAWSGTGEARTCLVEGAVDAPCYAADSTAPDYLICSAYENTTFCNQSGVCQAPAPVGSPCPRDSEGMAHCVEGSGCSAEGLCALPGGPGSACLELSSYSTQCGENQACVDGICKTNVPYGGDCSNPNTSQCVNAPCVEGICVPQSELTLLEQACGPLWGPLLR